MSDDDAFGVGYDAYWDGIDRKDNPYDQEKDPQDHQSWLEGWHKAREHDYDESEG